MGDREEALQRWGVFWCPPWCVQDPEEHQYEVHWGEWTSATISDQGDAIRVRPVQSWFDNDDDTIDWKVEIDAVKTHPVHQLVLDPAALSDLRTLLENAESVAQAWDEETVKPSYRGAEQDAGG